MLKELDRVKICQMVLGATDVFCVDLSLYLPWLGEISKYINENDDTYTTSDGKNNLSACGHL